MSILLTRDALTDVQGTKGGRLRDTKQRDARVGTQQKEYGSIG